MSVEFEAKQRRDGLIRACRCFAFFYFSSYNVYGPGFYRGELAKQWAGGTVLDVNMLLHQKNSHFLVKVMQMQRRVLHVGPCRWSGVPLLRSGEERPMPRPSPIPRGQSSFEFFFRPIIGSLAAYWWLDPPLCFSHVVAPELDDVWEPIAGDRWAPPGTVLPGLAPFILEDWCVLIGLQERPSEVVAQAFRNQRRSHWEADLAFCNVDGAFWLMHSRDEQLYATVEGYLNKITEADCYFEEVDACSQ